MMRSFFIPKSILSIKIWFLINSFVLIALVVFGFSFFKNSKENDQRNLTRYLSILLKSNEDYLRSGDFRSFAELVVQSDKGVYIKMSWENENVDIGNPSDKNVCVSQIVSNQIPLAYENLSVKICKSFTISKEYLYILFGIFSFLLISTFLVIKRFESKTIKQLLRLVSNWTGLEIGGNLDVTSLVNKIIDLNSNLEEAKKNEEKYKELEIVAKISSQVAHDIRSPLASLNTVIVCMSDKIPEEPRTLIRAAAQRIGDIANDLSSRKAVEVGRTTSSEKQVVTTLLSATIDLIISEKRFEYREKSNIDISTELKDSYGLFASIHLSDFKRSISNLVNNSVQAFEHNLKGRVVVLLNEFQERILIKVSDNGKGIPPDILGKLCIQGNTFGKKDGKGLGLYFAKTSVESWGGELRIESEVGSGTDVIIYLPKAKEPEWFVPELKINDRTQVIIIDDDESIHRVWDSRFSGLKVAGDHILHFTNSKDVADFCVNNKDKIKSCLFLCDYELCGNEMTGLDIVEQNGIAGCSILVTSRYEDKDIRERCERLKIKLLPKALAGFVPIKVLERLNLKDVEFVLIDDSDVTHRNWLLTAKWKNRRIVVFYSADEFYLYKDEINKEAKIYIDSNLGNGVKGEVIAKEIYNMGFVRIYLCTGYSASSFPEMPWIKEIVGKEPPFLKEEKEEK